MTCDRDRSLRGLRHLAVAAAALAAGACASPPSDGPRQYLDEKSAATVTVARESLVFARDRPELAVHARDYLTLVPIDVNRMGRHAVYFYGYVWSTIDKREAGAHDGIANFEIVADGRRIPLVPVNATPRELGLVEPPLRAPSASARLLIVRTDRETLALVADASELSAAELRDGLSESYVLWSGNPAELLALR
ncbi:MAG: hypothetical protein MUO39_08865 [Steroidobacteraceae bacterium]|nr:hypothetical protein [Steroidobacteraceae bacterium]